MTSIEELEPGLGIIDGGTERSVDSGFIDITAKAADGTVVVIELKAGTARRDAVGQILSYMGDVAAEGTQPGSRDFSSRATSTTRLARRRVSSPLSHCVATGLRSSFALRKTQHPDLMAFKIFYAWQSDRPNNLCRGLIRRALEDAAKELEADPDIQDAERDGIEIDSDTQDIPGSPPVAETIFEKIRESDVFVADLTPIDLIVPEDDDAEVRRQPPPNPNVMLEYGYALNALGDKRLIGVFNKAFGKSDDLPFDLRHRRWPIGYQADASDDAEQRRQAGQNLAKALASAIRPIIQDTTRPAEPMQQLCDRAVALIKKGTDAFIAAVNHRGVDTVEIQRLQDALIMRVGLVLDPARPGELPTTEFMNKVAVSNPQYTGWPVWLDSRDADREEHRTYVLDGVWQALIVNLGDGWSQHCEFLRFDPMGEFYLRTSNAR